MTLKSEPTQDQLAWLTGRLDQLSIRLRARGDQHITDLNEEGNKHSLKLKGGKGYTKRCLQEDWSIHDISFTCIHPFPELQDKVLTMSDTSKALSENQIMIATELDKAIGEMSKLE